MADSIPDFYGKIKALLSQNEQESVGILSVLSQLFVI